MRKTPSLAVILLVPALLAGAAPAAADGPKPKDDELICRANRATGSRIRINKRCMTRAEWDKIETETRKAVDDFSVRSSANSGGGGGAASGGPR